MRGSPSVGRSRHGDEHREPPATAVDLDHLKFCLGFPDVELAIAPSCWALVVHTRCRHLDGSRCSLYGKPERPLRCSLLNAWDCAVRRLHEAPELAGAERLGFEDFKLLLEGIRLDVFGRILAFPEPEELFQRLRRYES